MFSLVSAFMAVMLATVGLGGCAYVDVKPVHPADKFTRGLRVHEQVPILIVTSEGPKVEYINHPDRAYAVKFGAFLAKNDFKLDLNPNGTVKQLHANMDNTRLVEFLQVIGGKLLDEFDLAAPQPAAGGNDLEVFSFVFEDGELVGLRRLHDVPL